jgi:hypothetical protein
VSLSAWVDSMAVVCSISPENSFKQPADTGTLLPLALHDSFGDCFYLNVPPEETVDFLYDIVSSQLGHNRDEFLIMERPASLVGESSQGLKTVLLPLNRKLEHLYRAHFQSDSAIVVISNSAVIKELRFAVELNNQVNLSPS